MERRPAVPGFRIHICPSINEERECVGVFVVVGCGVVERREANSVLRIHIRPGLDEERHDLRVIVVFGGDVERREPLCVL